MHGLCPEGIFKSFSANLREPFCDAYQWQKLRVGKRKIDREWDCRKNVKRLRKAMIISNKRKGQMFYDEFSNPAKQDDFAKWQMILNWHQSLFLVLQTNNTNS